MIDQNDRQDESLTVVKSAIRPNILRWPAVIFSPVIVDWLFIAMFENLTKSMSHMACFFLWKLSVSGWETAFLPGNTKWRMNCNCLCSIKNAHFKEFWILIHNIITYWVHPGKGTCMQPSKLKFLLGHYLATNSFGLGRLFYKSSRQLQNFTRYGDQNGPNLEGSPDAPYRHALHGSTSYSRAT